MKRKITSLIVLSSMLLNLTACSNSTEETPTATSDDIYVQNDSIETASKQDGEVTSTETPEAETGEGENIIDNLFSFGLDEKYNSTIEPNNEKLEIEVYINYNEGFIERDKRSAMFESGELTTYTTNLITSSPFLLNSYTLDDMLESANILNLVKNEETYEFHNTYFDYGKEDIEFQFNGIGYTPAEYPDLPSSLFFELVDDDIITDPTEVNNTCKVKAVCSVNVQYAHDKYDYYEGDYMDNDCYKQNAPFTVHFKVINPNNPNPDAMYTDLDLTAGLSISTFEKYLEATGINTTKFLSNDNHIIKTADYTLIICEDTALNCIGSIILIQN